MSHSTARPLAAELLGSRAGLPGLIRSVLLAFVGAAALYVSAKLKVPFWPVPMTMQTFVVLLIGAAYGWRLGIATVLLYLAQGAMGLPVFTNTPPLLAGPAYFLSPTGGFLIGFIAAAAIVGWAVERGAARRVFVLGAWMLAAMAVLFALGLVWLGQAVPSVGYTLRLLEIGLLPFLLGDIVKVALAACLVVGVRQVFRRS